MRPMRPPLALLLLVLVSAASAAQLRQNYCTDNNFFWKADGPVTVTAATPNWASIGENAAFQQGPCLGLSGIGMTQTFSKKIIIIDRSTAVNGWLPLASSSTGGQTAGQMAYAIEVDFRLGQQRGLDILTDAFCSSGQFSTDGSLLSVGGDVAGSYTQDGTLSVRKYGPCFGRKPCSFKIAATMSQKRWYPTTAQLGDGRMIIVGGSSSGALLNNANISNPTIEYFPKKASAPGAVFESPLIRDTLPYNLFPFLHVLPSGRVFIFASHMWTLWDSAKNVELPGTYPPIVENDGQGSPLRFNYPAAATTAMFPVSPDTGKSTEIMICGGTSIMASGYITVNGTQQTVDNPNYPATNKCFRIQPESDSPVWEGEEMVAPRVMPMSVLLPSGQLVILGGTGEGHSGIGAMAHKPALTPEIYDTASHTWYKNPLPASKIPRSYHSSAVVLHNGAVFISGSNPNVGIKTGNDDFPTEFRSEIFQPPYHKPGTVLPTLGNIPKRLSYGQKINVNVSYAGVVNTLQVVAVQPGFSTHGANHGMRNVIMRLMKLEAASGINQVVTVRIPGNRNLLPPTWYWLFVVVNGVPNREGHYFIVSGPRKRHAKHQRITR